ncbi:heparinase II/III family protein [Elizabethkingia sp. JS20170427COW]|uniref:heparinase II/III domain-containing protein n=1 Tax=Elizabethkingia sp. JS20170427COW TaxID=2583851 RepID=UPI0011108308|nr:heparinase II/III family protein [Elizabethkingia sp. JS20170427COW]QCX52803.1 heparinase [Elizabethkingia sp. JS20170427COW]
MKNAIVEKGLKPSFDKKYNAWLQVKNNWNQVCNAGMTVGAMAVYEDYPELAEKIIERSIQSVQIPMKRYAPDGTCPEGYSCWAYGTTYSVLLIDALEGVLETYFGLKKSPGFLKTASFFQQLLGPTQQSFNYSDGNSTPEMAAASFWFAHQNNTPSLAWNDVQMIKEGNAKMMEADRFLPFVLIWGNRLGKDKIQRPQQLFWSRDGENLVALMRTSWKNKDALSLGFKLGSHNMEYGHMDVGSFVFDALGERWSMDFKMQSYITLEQKGLNLWTYGQNSDRWTVFRYKNQSHSTLTFDEQLQVVKGKAVLGKTSSHPNFSFAISDISELYANKVKKAVRGVALRNKKYALIQDEITTGPSSVKLRWSMPTEAKAEVLSPNELLLTKNGEKLLLKVHSDVPVQATTWSTTSPNDFDAPNPGSGIVGFEANIPSESEATFSVQLIPKAKVLKSEKIIPLSQW